MLLKSEDSVLMDMAQNKLFVWTLKDTDFLWKAKFVAMTEF